MVSPTFLVPRLAPIVCPHCGRPPAPTVQVVGQALRPIAGTSLVAAQIAFECPTCRSVRCFTQTLSRERVLQLVEQAIDNDRCNAAFSTAIEVRVPIRPRPSIRNGTPPTPISVDEIAKARRILERTSFRRTTKSWAGFMKRLRKK